MKRKILKGTFWTGEILLALLLLFVGFNQIDEKADPNREFTRADLAQDDFSADNGYTLLWSLPEPPGVDVNRPEIREKYLSLYDPARGATENLKRWQPEVYKGYYRNNYLKKKRLLEKEMHRDPTEDVPQNPSDDWMPRALQGTNYFREWGKAYAALLGRYEALIAAPAFQEYLPARYDAQLPNLLCWLQTAKLYDNLCLLRAGEGDYDGAAGRLLDHLDFSRKAMAGSRVLVTRLIALATFRLNCQALASLLNQEACPPAVAAQVFARLTPLQTRETGLRECLVSEYLAFAGGLKDPGTGIDSLGEGLASIRSRWHRLFFQPNRTFHLMHDWAVLAVELGNVPPHRWRVPLEELRAKPRRGMWWLRNRTGKILMGVFEDDNNQVTLHKHWLARTQYDLLRISAELHARYDGSRTVAELLPTLESHRTVDPCSGRPYRWNEAKQWLYSVGVDRQDDGGLDRAREHLQGTDYVLPCVVWLKPAR